MKLDKPLHRGLEIGFDFYFFSVLYTHVSMSQENPTCLFIFFLAHMAPMPVFAVGGLRRSNFTLSFLSISVLSLLQPLLLSTSCCESSVEKMKG